MALAAGLRAGDPAEVCVRKRTIGHVELRSISDVGAFRTELQGKSLGEIEALEDGEIERPRGRSVIGLQTDLPCVSGAAEVKFAVLNHSLGVRPPAGAAFGTARAN